VHVGFVVSKAVGNAVVRNRVRRRLRHLARGQLAKVPAGVNLVVRALPQAAVTPKALPEDLDRAWSRAIARLPR
jgi:ribonuclease P protein component